MKKDLGDLCTVFNLAAAFILFELLCAGIAVLCRYTGFAALLFLPAYFISLWAAHRVFPHIVNRIIGVF